MLLYASRLLPECVHPVLQDPADNTLAPFNMSTFNPDPQVSAVLCGLDTAINYTKLSKAFQYLLRDPECVFLATNEDSTFPTGGGLLPGAGALSAPLRFALGRDPTVIGKPASTMLDCIKAKLGPISIHAKRSGLKFERQDSVRTLSDVDDR